jgi:hypothetical protein
MPIICLCHSLALDEVSISGLGLDSPAQQPWVHVMLKYRMAAQNPNGEQVVNNLSTFEHIISFGFSAF